MLTRSTFVAGLLVPGAAAAHGSGPHAALDPVAVTALVILAGVSAAGTARLRRQRGPGRGLPRGRAASLLSALVLLWLALVWPLEPLAEASAAAHMTQHMLLILAVPPLFLVGRGGAVLLHGLPSGLRRGTGAAVRRLRGPWRVLGRPGTAFVLHLTAVWMWHAPAAFEAALASWWVHLAEHLTLLVTAVLLWGAVLEARRGDARGLANAAFLTLGTLMHTGLLGALLTFAPAPLYPSYQGVAPGGLTPLEDQQLAGLIMWVPGGAGYVAGFLLVAGGWLRRAEGRSA